MGAFDDLIPQGSPAAAARGPAANPFEDLVPIRQDAAVEDWAAALAARSRLAEQSQPAEPAGSGDVSVNSLVRATATGVPIVGGLLNKANAATNATLAPLLNPLFDQQNRLEGDWSQRYERSLQQQGAMDTAFAREHPNINTAANIAGGVASVVPLGATALGARALGVLPNAGLGTQALAGAASGAGIGAADALARGEDPSFAGAIGGAFGAAGPVVGRAIGAGINAATGLSRASRAAPSIEALIDASDAGYKAARATGVEIKGSAISGLGQRAQADLHSDGFRDYLAPKTFAALAEMQAPTSGAFATAGDLDGMRKVLTRAARDFSNPTEQAAASRAIEHFDNFMSNIPSSDVIRGDAARASNLFNQARGNYATAMRAQQVRGLLDQSELQAAAANSGQNIENIIRQRFRTILSSDKLRTGFTQPELAEMQRITRGGAIQNTGRFFGNLFGGGGGLGALASGGFGLAASGHPLGVVLPAVGYLLKQATAATTTRRAAQLEEAIRLRAPVAAPQAAAAAQARMTNQDAMRRAAIVAAILRQQQSLPAPPAQ